MAITIFRATELHNVPARKATKKKPARPATRGKLGVGKTYFYEKIKPRLEWVSLGGPGGPVGFTDRSVDKLIEEGIAAAAAKREAK
jgi:hypothetical protein